jgi:RNA polymerase sigma factor (TIGR02999 family)
LSELTDLFDAATGGDRPAMDRLMVIMYQELRQLAHRRLHSTAGSNVLETTALVHETYLRFLKVGQLRVTDRGHFLAYSSRVMRSIIIDLVRRQRSERHGGNGALQVTLNTDIADERYLSEEQILMINESLEGLAHGDPRLVQVVEMRYFGGLGESEVAEALGVTVRTVRRDWQKARLLLSAALGFDR